MGIRPVLAAAHDCLALAGCSGEEDPASVPART